MSDARSLFGAFYDTLYSAVPDRHELLGVILSRKERFADEALHRVLADELGLPAGLGGAA